jgi:hypothetical protein
MFGGDGTLGKFPMSGAWAKTERKNRGIIDAKTPKEANFIPLPNQATSVQSSRRRKQGTNLKTTR